MQSLEFLGGVASLGGRTVTSLFERPFELQETLKQIHYLGISSLSIAMLTAFFTGMVLSLQMAVSMERFGSQEYVAIIVGLAITRELGPVLTSVVVGGRVGSGITAEIGSMQVTEQIDAIRALGANPIKKLVVPRLVAMLIVLPMLTFLADVVGVAGGLIISVVELDLNAYTYLWDTINTISMEDLFSGIAKTFFFAGGITLISCHYGMRTSGGTEGVGNATTRTVVASLIYIFVADFFLTKAMMIL